MNLPAGNWDSAFVDNPDTLDIDRNPRGHLGFGFGVHQCIGQNLARVELQIALVDTGPSAAWPSVGGSGRGAEIRGRAGDLRHRTSCPSPGDSVEPVEALGVQAADLRAGLLADVGAGAQMLCALRPFAVPVRVVAGEHDEVVAEHVDDAGQDRLLGLAGRPDVACLQVLLRVALPAVRRSSRRASRNARAGGR